MAQQSAVEFLKDQYELTNGKLIMQDFEYAEKMETNNTRYACGLAISKLIYQQAINTQMPDEEIEKRVKEVGAMGDFYKMGYRDACKWYREQLKVKI